VQPNCYCYRYQCPRVLRRLFTAVLADPTRYLPKGEAGRPLKRVRELQRHVVDLTRTVPGKEWASTDDDDAYVIGLQELADEVFDLLGLGRDTDQNAGWGDGYWFQLPQQLDPQEWGCQARMYQLLAPHLAGCLVV